MTTLITSEALKLRTLVLPRAVLAVGAVMSGVIGYAVVDIAAGDGEAATLTQLATSNSESLWFLAVIVAVLATAGEYQHRTIASTLIQAPRRGPVLAAKATVAAGYGAALALLGAAVALTAGAVTSQVQGLTVGAAGNLVPAIGGMALLGAGWAVLAVGLGALVRNSAVALVSVLVWKFVIENVIPVVTNSQDVQPWLPSYAANAVLSGGESLNLLAPVTGGLVFAGYAAVIVAAGSLMFLRRDPT